MSFSKLLALVLLANQFHASVSQAGATAPRSSVKLSAPAVALSVRLERILERTGQHFDDHAGAWPAIRATSAVAYSRGLLNGLMQDLLATQTVSTAADRGLLPHLEDFVVAVDREWGATLREIRLISAATTRPGNGIKENVSGLVLMTARSEQTVKYLVNHLSGLVERGKDRDILNLQRRLAELNCRYESYDAQRNLHRWLEQRESTYAKGDRKPTSRSAQSEQQNTTEFLLNQITSAEGIRNLQQQLDSAEKRLLQRSARRAHHWWTARGRRP